MLRAAALVLGMSFLPSFLATGRLLLAGLLLVAGPARSQFYRIDLTAEKIDVPASPWQVTRVLDLRPDRSRLGPVRQGLSNEVGSADFSQPLAAELLQLVRAQVPLRAGARPVVMRVFTLALSEDLRANSEAGEAELVADFLEPQPDSTFRVLLAVGESTRRSGLDVTKHHAANLALLLQQGLRQLATQPAPAPNAETLSLAEARAGRGGALSQRFPIQAAATPRRGFYRSFREFRDNAPSEPDYAFAIEHIAHAGKRWAGTDEVQATYLRTDAKHQRTLVGRGNLWGLSDGREMLIAHRGHFYKLLPAADGHRYTFSGPPLFDEQTANNMAAAALLGGAVGAAIVGAASTAPPTLPYEVHLASGRVVPVPDAGHSDADGFQSVPDTAHVYVLRRADSPKNRPATLRLPGRVPQRLAARQWVAMPWTDRRQELTLCAQTEGGPEICFSLVPDFSQPTYVECIVPADGGAPAFRRISAREGTFEMRRLRLLAKSQP